MALKGELHPNSKLTADQVLEIRKLSKQGFTHRVIAKNHNISTWNVKSIVKGKTWKHLLVDNLHNVDVNELIEDEFIIELNSNSPPNQLSCTKIDENELNKYKNK